MSYIKLTNIVLTAVFVVNGFMFALPVMAQAQAVEKQAIEQSQLSQAQKAELEKAQKDAKLAMYKELNLSTTEQKFVEKYADKMDSFNQALDKYVSYDKKNGNATLNVVVVYNNLKSISKETGLTQSQVLTLKDIALKMVKNYNKTVNSIKSQTISAQKSTGAKSASVQEISETKVTKLISDRGVEVQFERNDIVDTYAKAASSACVERGYVVNIYYYWWGKNEQAVVNSCFLTNLLGANNSGNVYGYVSGLICAGWAGIGFIPGVACSAIAGAIGLYVSNYTGNISHHAGKCGMTRFWITTGFYFIPYMHSLSCA